MAYFSLTTLEGYRRQSNDNPKDNQRKHNNVKSP